MTFYLIGYPLGYSYSPEIHRLFNESIEYYEKPLKEEELGVFLRKKAFAGLNVTIPYKEKVLPFLDEIDDAAKTIGAVNTIVCRENRLIGYNTDYSGVERTLAHHRVDVKGKIAMILGSGGTYKTIRYVLEKAGAKKIIGVSRNPRDENFISYSEAVKMKDIQILINTTPVGTFPATDEAPLLLDDFPNLQCVFDMIYNPYRTELLLRAKERGIKTINGLMPLVYQAGLAEELFFSSPIDEDIYREVYAETRRKKRSIVLIGMSGSGKSSAGALLSERLNLELVDLDREVEKHCRCSIKEIFEKRGEAHFRKCEEEIALKSAFSKGKVIVTGGGLVENDRAMRFLCQTGLIVNLKRKTDESLFGKDRPKLRNRQDYDDLYEKRKEKYLRYADATIENDDSLEETVSKVVKIDESDDY